MQDKPTNDTPQQPSMTTSPIIQQPINGQPSGLGHKKGSDGRGKLFFKLAIAVAVLIVGSILSMWLWLSIQLSPLGDDKQQLIAITIKPGSTPSEIGKLLKEKSVIRSADAFDIHTRLSGTRGLLQAGTYRLSPSESTQQIVGHLTSGKVDQFSITFLPGATLAEHKKVLRSADFSDAEIDEAFSATYESPLFEGRPAGADLEGYIYGETYNFSTGSSVGQILERTFQEFYDDLQSEGLIEKIQQRDLTLYQGITLASIIQREESKTNDQKQVAQVFYTRLEMGMPLGSDVTYQYAAEKLGVERDVNLDSPYNTRRYTGLPPGPIASPGLDSLRATAEPASGSYVYFLSGDDDKTYFSYTFEEHEANIRDHCKVKCSTL